MIGGLCMQNQDQTIQKAMELAGTPDGKQLIQKLQKTGGATLEEAMKKAAGGDFSQAKQVLSQLMNDPEVRKLLDSLGK